MERRKNEDKEYDLEMYEGRQEARKLIKDFKKEMEEDYVYHELEQNVILSSFKTSSYTCLLSCLVVTALS